MRRFSMCLILLCAICSQTMADERVPAYLIRLPATVKTVFVAETSAAAFHRFENLPELGIHYRGPAYMSIGQEGDGKQRNGDRRTPLGIYFVTEQLDTSRMHEKYGTMAFPLDYPNAWDHRMQRTGDGIWVHGVDRRGGERPPRDTDGCIALPNEILGELENAFLPNVTPVVIARKVDWVDPRQVDALRAELDDAVTAWAGSLQSGDLHTYLSLYDADFRHWGMNKAEWTAFRVQTLADRSIQKVTLGDVLLLGYPEEDGLYLSRFQLRIEESPNAVETTQRLYWRRSGSGALKIIAEDSG